MLTCRPHRPGTAGPRLVPRGRGRSGLPTALVLVALLLASPAAAGAQELHGRLATEGSGEPLEGALVVLETPEGAGRDTTISEGDGAFALTAPAAGRYRLRVQRIGYRTWTSSGFRLAPGSDLRRTFRVPVRPVELQTIEVTDERSCSTPREEGRLLARVWEEARKALETARVSAEEAGYRFTVRSFTRTLGPDGRRVQEESSHQYTTRTNQPFTSPPPRQIREEGFVAGELGDGRTYYGPDLRTLLSDAFLETHCFRVDREGGDSPRLALRFTPISERDVPEIEGTLRVDEETAELESLEYHYVHIGLGREEQAVGGEVDFQRLPDGRWVIRAWRIRTPHLARRSGPSLRGGEGELEIRALRETGRQVVRIRSTAGELLFDLERATLAGTVRDSTSGDRLAGAVVRVEGTDWRDTTGANGEYRITGLPEGRYGVSFAHPRLDSLGIASLPDRMARLEPGQITRLDLSVPGWTRLLAAGCEDPASAVVGRVRDELTGRPLSGVRVEARRLRAGAEAEIRGTRTDGRGHFRLCGLGEDRIRLAAGDTSAVASGRELDLSGEEPLRADFELPVSEPTTVVGRVLAAGEGRPLTGASVRIEGRELGTRRAVTGSDGRFRVGELPPGRYRLQVEHVGYRTAGDSLTVAGGDTVRLTARIAADTVELEPLSVTVDRPRGGEEHLWSLPGVDRESVRSYVLDRQEIAAENATSAASLVRRLNAPGLIVTEGTGRFPDRQVCVEIGRSRSMSTDDDAQDCHMVQVYLDGTRIADPRAVLVDLQPERIERIELLPPSQAGARFGTNADNGVLLIYTRRGERGRGGRP